MTILIVGLVVFFGIHSVSIVSAPWRDGVVARLGENGWKGIYTLIAIVGLVLIIWGYGVARQQPVVLYVPPVWQRHVAMLLMIPVFPLLLATYFPGHISHKIGHPMLTATKLWATAHLLANGMAADVLLFGIFLAWAVADRVSMKRRTQRDIPTLPSTRWNDAIAVALGLLIYVALVFGGHRWLVGVPVIVL